MALKIVTGGTTGAADGTLVSSGNPLVIVALNTAVDCHIRCDDGYWSNDQDFDVPAELEVSFDGGSTWYDNADEPITAPEIEDVNYPIKIRQTTAAGSTSGSFVTDGTYTAIASLSTPTLTATVVNASQIDLSWTNVANEDASPGYTIERSPDGSSWSALTTKAANVTTHSDTGLTASTHYYYRVKAEGSGRYSDSGWGTDDDTTSASVVAGFAAAVSGTTVALSWSAYDGADHYQIEWGTDGVTYGNTIDSVSGTSYNHTGRTANTTYYYRIKAHDSGHSAITSAYATCYAGVQIAFYSHTSDGQIINTNASWATLRALTTGTVQNGGTAMQCRAYEDTGTYGLRRAFLGFDTSSLPDTATIDESVLSLYVTSKSGTSDACLVASSAASGTALASGDFDNVGSTLFASRKTQASVTTSAYNTFTLNSSGIAAISKTGYTLLALRIGYDFDNSAPASAADSDLTYSSADETGTGQDPLLTVSFHG